MVVVVVMAGSVVVLVAEALNGLVTRTTTKRVTKWAGQPQKF